MGQHSSSEKGAIGSAIMVGEDDDAPEQQQSNQTVTSGKQGGATTSSGGYVSKNKINESIQIVSIEKDNEDEYDFLVKVVLVGDYGVGTLLFDLSTYARQHMVGIYSFD